MLNVLCQNPSICVYCAYPSICVYCAYPSICVYHAYLSCFKVLFLNNGALLGFDKFSISFFFKSFVATNPFLRNANLNSPYSIELNLSPNFILVLLCLFLWIMHFERERKSFVRKLLHAILHFFKKP